MNKENKPNNSPIESEADALEKNLQKAEETLKSIEGLYELLEKIISEAGFGKLTKEDLSPYLKEVAGHMADDKEVEKAVNTFLDYMSENSNLRKPGADIIKKKLPLVLEDELRERSGEK